MDNFSHGIPPPNSHGERNIIIVGGAVLIVTLGFLVLKYWNKLSSPVPTELPGTSQKVSQKVYTPEEKAKILRSLQQAPSTTATSTQPSSITPVDRAKILRDLNTKHSSQAAPQPSTDEKMKLLQSLHQ